MTETIGYSLVEHAKDGTSKTVYKIGMDKLTAMLVQLQMPQQRGKYTYLNADECPVHGPWRAVPGGISKNTGKPYNAFWACDQEKGEERCLNKPHADWVETHPADRAANDTTQEDVVPKGYKPTESAADFDDLPF